MALVFTEQDPKLRASFTSVSFVEESGFALVPSDTEAHEVITEKTRLYLVIGSHTG